MVHVAVAADMIVHVLPDANVSVGLVVAKSIAVAFGDTVALATVKLTAGDAALIAIEAGLGAIDPAGA